MSIHQSHLTIQDWGFSWSSNTLATWCEELLIGKDPDAGKDWGQEEKEEIVDETVGWHHWLDRHESEQTSPSMVKDVEAWHAAVHGLQRVGHDLAAEQQQQAS